MKKIFYPDPGVTWQNLHNVMHEPDAEHIFDCSFEPEAYFDFSCGDTIVDDRNKHLVFLKYHNTTKTKPLCKVLTCGFDFHTSGRKYQKSVGLMTAEEDFPIVPEWSEVIEWKSRLFYSTVLERNQFIHKAQHFVNTLELEKLFVSLNLRVKNHRTELMKIFLDRDVMHRGVIRFANSRQEWNRVLTNKHKYFSEDYLDKIISHAPDLFSPFNYNHIDLAGQRNPYDKRIWSIDPFYLTGLFDIAAETSTQINLISQKSLQPLVFKKPFCMIGSANQNIVMKDMGFELFDEFFDYSHESKDLTSIRTRSDQYTHYDNMLKDLWDLDDSPKALKNLYESLTPKLEHNLDRFVKVLFDDDYVPDIVLEHTNSRLYDTVQSARNCAIQDPYYKKYLPV